MGIASFGLKSFFLVFGIGCAGCVNLIPKLINKNVSVSRGPYAVARLGGSYDQKKYELFIIGDKIFTNVGEWLRFSDLSFEIDGKKLTGEAKLKAQNQDYCLESEGGNLKWCWRNEGGLGSAGNDTSWELKNLVFKFNFDSNTYFPQDKWDYALLAVAYNKIGNQNCSFENASTTCVAGHRQFDLIRGELI